MRNLDYNANKLTNETETDSQPQRTDLCLPGRRWMGRMDWEFGYQVQTIIHRVDKLQGLAVWHRELYSLL